MADTRYLTAMDEARRDIPRLVRMLMAARRVTGPEVAEAIGMSASSFYARLNGKSVIQAAELAALALYFGMPINFFYDPPVGIFEMEETRNVCFSEIRVPIPA